MKEVFENFIDFRFKTPQLKKELSYKKDRRNTYGECTRGTRKGIPFRKKQVNQDYRRLVKSKLYILNVNNLDESELLDYEVNEIKRKYWKKLPDISLGLYLEYREKNIKSRIYKPIVRKKSYLD